MAYKGDCLNPNSGFTEEEEKLYRVFFAMAMTLMRGQKSYWRKRKTQGGLLLEMSQKTELRKV